MQDLLNTIENEEIRSKVKEYLKFNKVIKDQETILDLIKDECFQELERLFAKRLEFGTAGLRARMGVGYAQMNQLTIIQTTQGLYHYLIKKYPDLRTRGCVIGRDHRHNSNEFARLTAAVFLYYGVKMYYFPNLVHTPMVPFGVKNLNAVCGIMLTASHNPKDDNGYKVYSENGCQIISPVDAEIAMEITRNLEPIVWDLNLVNNSDLVVDPSYLISEYFGSIKKYIDFSVFKDFGVKICYTAMHGVGLPMVLKGVEMLGIDPLVLVSSQCEPDPNFSTVKFPNPEERGALDLAMQVASSQDCPVIFANDPDADRFAVAEMDLNTQQW